MEGVTAQAGQSLDRGQAALLLYNLLRLPDAQGKTFALRLGDSWVEDAVLLDTSGLDLEQSLAAMLEIVHGRQDT